MTSPTNPGPEPQQIEGRSVRDIAEYSPEQVNDAWCRRIFRQILQSLELQYAMHMPHRAITPDTIVFHENGEPLLTPLDIGPPDDREAEDLNALARVVHYAITQELVPLGPLAGRVDGYSDTLLDAVDRCMDADPARRPQTIDALRALLGIVPPGAPVRGAPHDMPSDLPADALALPETGTAVPPHDVARDDAHDGLPPAGAAADPSGAAHDAPRGAQVAADHGRGVPDIRPVTGQDNVPAAQHAPGHEPAGKNEQTVGPAAVHAPPQVPGHDATRVPQPPAARDAAPAAPHIPATPDTHGTAAPPGHDAAPVAPPAAARAAVPAAPHVPATPDTHGTVVPPSHDAAPVAPPAAARDAAHAAPHAPATHGTAAPGSRHAARPAPGHADEHAVPHVPSPGRASATAHGAGPAAAPAVTPTARTIPPPAPGTRTTPRRRAGLSNRQRWALAAGVAVFVGLALATLAELRDSGPFEHIDLAAPQPADATHAAPDAAASAPAAQPGVDGTAGGAPAAGTAVPAAPAGAGVAAGLAPGETIVPGSAVPAPGAGKQPPGVVVTPNGNVYKLQIQPWGTVYVDGVDRGVSPPVKRLTLAPGRHTVRITNPNFEERVIEVDTATGDGQISVDFTADPPR